MVNKDIVIGTVVLINKFGVDLVVNWFGNRGV